MSSPKVNTLWFQHQFRAKDLTQRGVAKALKMDPGNLARRLKGLLRFQIDEATQLAQMLSVPLEEVLVNAGINPPAVPQGSLSVKGWVDSDYRVHFEPPRGPKLAPKPMFDIKNVEVLRFQTMGTVLDGVDGTLVYYSPQSGVNGDLLGKICVVKIYKKKEPVLRVLKRGYSVGTYNLFLISGQAKEEDVAIDSASPVVWMKF